MSMGSTTPPESGFVPGELGAVMAAYPSWPDDIRAKLSLHDLRRMSGWRPKHEQKPTAWTGSGSIAALAKGEEGCIWPTRAASHPIPLYASPQADKQPADGKGRVT